MQSLFKQAEKGKEENQADKQDLDSKIRERIAAVWGRGELGGREGFGGGGCFFADAGGGGRWGRNGRFPSLL